VLLRPRRRAVQHQEAIASLLDLTVELGGSASTCRRGRQGKGGDSILLVFKTIAGEGVCIGENTQCDMEGLQTDSILN
jgi:hypothetical protein